MRQSQLANYELDPDTMHGAQDDLLGKNSFQDDADMQDRTCLASFAKPFEETKLHDRDCGKKGDVLQQLTGKVLGSCGPWLLQKVLEVLPLRSKFTGKATCRTLFPLPTSRSILCEAFPSLSDDEMTWLVCVCMGLNSMWGETTFSDSPIRGCQGHCIEYLVQHVQRFCKVDARVEDFCWEDFHRVKSIDYKGEEVKVARWFSWKNVSPALPAEIGKVALSDVCALGCKHYVEHFELYLKPVEQWKTVKPPRVMVHDSDWEEVCKGLIKTGVCTIMPLEELHHVQGQPLLNGLFGVSKEDFTDEGIEIYRLWT